MKSLTEYVKESAEDFISLEHVAHALQPYIKQWYKYLPYADSENGEIDIVPVKTAKEALTIYNHADINFESKKGLFGVIRRAGRGSFEVYIHDHRFDNKRYAFGSCDDKWFKVLVDILKTVKG